MSQAKPPTVEQERDALFYVLVEVASLVGAEVSIEECLAAYGNERSPVSALSALKKIVSDLELQKKERFAITSTLKGERDKLLKKCEALHSEKDELQRRLEAIQIVESLP